MEYIIVLIISTVIGIFIGAFLMKDKMTKSLKVSGTFIIDLSDPMKDVCKLELDENLESIYTKNQIVLKVKTYDESSPK